MRDPKLFYRSDAAPAAKPYHYKESGLTNVYLMNGYNLETYDGEEYVSVENVEGLWKAIGLNLITSRKTLLPREIRFLRTRMEKTQAEMATLLRVDDQTVARWEKGLARMPGPADVALRVFFLTSPVAQPEGRRIIAKFIELVRDLVEQDAPPEERLVFTQHGEVWERNRPAELC